VKGRKKKGLCQQDRPVIEPNAAGVDVGAREMYVAISPDRDSEPVRVFPTFTADLEELVQWLLERGITTVAMESTGVYWIPLYQMLEDRGVVTVYAILPERGYEQSAVILGASYDGFLVHDGWAPYYGRTHQHQQEVNENQTDGDIQDARIEH